MLLQRYLLRIVPSAVLFFVLLINGCSAKQEIVKQTEQVKPAAKDSIYTFDETPTDSTAQIAPVTQEPENIPAEEPQIKEKSPARGFTVQLGAFTTLDKADEFAGLHRKKLQDKITVFYSDAVKLFVVQLLPLKSKTDAEKRRNELWQNEEYKDAFVIEVTENP